MCRQHLLGEHRELHTLVGTLPIVKHWDGYIRHNCLEFKSIQVRHDALVEEMLSRGYQHKTPLIQPQLPKALELITIDKTLSKRLLLSRCPQCLEKCVEILRSGGFTLEEFYAIL